jgi:hypothetical protein
MLEGCDTTKVINATKASPNSPVLVFHKGGDLKVPPKTFTPRVEAISTIELEAPNEI